MKESNQIIIDKMSLFGEVLEFVETNQIEQALDKLSKNIRLDGLMEEDEIKYEKKVNDNGSSSTVSYKINNPKRSRFPNYNGSFKSDINSFIQGENNKDIKLLYDIVLKEIKKIYHAYTHVENKLYNKINQYIKFSDAKNNTPMEIISKLKEISETLLDTIKFIELYLFKNFQILQKIFNRIDVKLSNTYGVESVSLFFLLDIFDLPNNELSYMLMFKIIDEESCVLKYLTKKLNGQLKDAEPQNNIIDNIETTEVKSTDNDACLLDDKSKLSLVAYNAMLNIRDKYLIKITESINDIDSYIYFRAKYYNKYIYIKGNYEIDTNLFLNNLEDNDDNMNEEFLPINSLMDEEIIIGKFIKKSVINKFLNHFKSQLSIFYKRNEILIMLHTIQYNVVLVLVFYWYDNFEIGLIQLALFYIGKIVSKILFNSFLKKRKRLKNLLIGSNFLLIISLIIPLLFRENKYYTYIYFASRFLIGLSFSKNIETKFILTYVPKLLVKKTIKKYFSLIYLSLCFGFFLTSGLNYSLSFLIKSEDNNENNNNTKKKLNINNIGEIIIAGISFIILIINCIFFRVQNYNDIIKSNNLIKVETNKSQKEKGKENVEDKKETTSIFSYGKAKLISFKEKNKAKIFDQNLQFEVAEKNYEGTNQLFSILQKLIINENFLGNSYTNQAKKGHIIFFTLLYILSSTILVYNLLINPNKKSIFESKNKIWIFGFPYLLSFLIYKFKIIKISNDISILNLIILIFICFEIGLNLIFLLFDNSFFPNKTPICFNNYYFFAFLSLILFCNNIIELFCLKVMIREIPIETKISSLNIDNYLDIHESIIRTFTFLVLFAMTYYDIIKDEFYIKIGFVIISILGCFSFFLYNFKRKQIALIKIINKVTYESF